MGENTSATIVDVNIDTGTTGEAGITMGDNSEVTIAWSSVEGSDNGENGSETAGIEVNGDATINVEGENTVSGGKGAAGIQVNEGSSVTISNNQEDIKYEDKNGNEVKKTNSENDKLTAEAGTAVDDKSGAGIGGASGQDAGKITITSGDEGLTVVASGAGDKKNLGSAGIGGGGNGSGGEVVIDGNATVIATGGDRSGEGAYRNNNDQDYNPYDGGGAGIGAGAGGENGGNVTIGGNANVTATGAYNGAGIGGASSGADGHDHGEGADVTVNGNATVNAKGGYAAAGIGGGARGNGKKVTINGGSVTARGGYGAAGIGGGNGGFYGGNKNAKTRNVNGGNGGEVTVNAGVLNAFGGFGAPGVGGGAGAQHAYQGKAKIGIGGSGAVFTVIGGSVIVNGGSYAVAVGSGCDTSWTGDLKQLKTDNNGKDVSNYFYDANKTDAEGELKISGGKGVLTPGGLLLLALRKLDSKSPDQYWGIDGVEYADDNGTFNGYIYTMTSLRPRNGIESVKYTYKTVYGLNGVYSWDLTDTEETPVTPPVTPPEDTPETPDTPDTPYTPDTPDTPYTPETPETPATPDTPAAPAQPVGPANVPAQPQTVNIQDEAVPLAAPNAESETAKPVQPVQLVNIPEQEIPLAKTRSWALVNLLCALGSAASALITLFAKKKDEENENVRNYRMTKTYSVILAILSAVVFILTELPLLHMTYVDSWTLAMALLLSVQLVGTAVGLRRRDEEQSEAKA